MVETLTLPIEGEEIVVQGHAVDSWNRMVMQACTRNLSWREIVAECVDNALANHKPNKPCVVGVEWATRKPKLFKVTDRGIGCTDPARFLRPGLGGNNESDLGNSTFGTGLFACEAHLQGEMVVATESDGAILRIIRTIMVGQDGTSCQYGATKENREMLGVPSDGGTVVQFSGYRKRAPAVKELDNIKRHLSQSYATAIEQGNLKIRLTLNGKSTRVQAESRPDVETLHCKTVTVDSHDYDVEWGVTTAPASDGGVRLVYGGKCFATAPEACGEFSVGRFYAMIRIPHGVGRECMDLMKRGVDREFMQDVFDECYVLFLQELRRSHELSVTDRDLEVNSAISRLLSKPRKGKDKGRGDEDRRQFNGRDPEQDGVEPGDTGRKRQGRCGKKKNNGLPSDMIIDWLEQSEDKAMASYDIVSGRLTYNTSHGLIRAWRKAEENTALAQVAAAFIAETTSKADPKNPSQGTFIALGEPFHEVYREMTSRITRDD